MCAKGHMHHVVDPETWNGGLSGIPLNHIGSDDLVRLNDDEVSRLGFVALLAAAAPHLGVSIFVAGLRVHDEDIGFQRRNEIDLAR